MTQKPTLLMIGAYPDWDMEALEATYDVIRMWEHGDADALLAQRGKDVRAIATRGDLGASKALIDMLPNLEFIGCFGVGTDGIDRTATRPRGIKISNTPDVLTEDVADLALALMLAIARHVLRGDQLVRRGAWPNSGLELVTRLNGKRLGIIGLGRIGKAIAKRGAGFSMPISYFGRHPQEDVDYTYQPSLEGLAADSDFLVAIVPGGAATTNLVTAEVLQALGPNGFFVNVARGSVVDEVALLHALENRTIKGAALDVFWNEPNIDARFLKLDNVVLHPHHGSGTVETRKAMGQLVRDNLAAHFSGQPLLTQVD
jgi:lactate dehydrogenase-like 2-hydroxyacid dehydrogenase